MRRPNESQEEAAERISNLPDDDDDAAEPQDEERG
jgi:hypothetical protein